MKKLFALLAFASLVFVACDPKEDPDKPDDGKDKPGEQTEYVAPINIDGDFSDWAKLDASKVATATTDPNATKTALKVAKVYADEYYIFGYFEFELGPIPGNEADMWLPLHWYLNADGSASTGGYADSFAEGDAEWLLETSVHNYDPALFKWWGEVGGTGWNWSDPNGANDETDYWGAIIPEGQGIGQSAGSVNMADGKGKYEISISRDMMPMVEFADQFTVGFDMSIGWDATLGLLPNAADGALAPKLKVTVNK